DALRALLTKQQADAPPRAGSGKRLRLRQSSINTKAQNDAEEIRAELLSVLSSDSDDASEELTTFTEQGVALREAMKALRITLQKLFADASTRARERLIACADDLKHILAHEADTHIYLVTARHKTIALEAIPLDVRPISVRHVSGPRGATVVTAATLATDGNLRYLRARVGAPKETIERTLESPF